MGLIERLGSEITYFRCAMRTLKRVSNIARNPTHSISDMLDELAQKYGNRTALIGGGYSYTYGMLNARANQYAHWAQSIGIQRGDSISLMMGNCPEYLAIWFGLVRAGARVALLNTNLTGHSLAHCMNIVPCKNTIFAAEFLDVFNALKPHLAAQPQLWVAGHSGGQGHSLYDAVSQMPPVPLPPKRKPKLTIEDPALYIYTSGTTGLPKAAIINHYRVQAIMNGFSAICDAQADDRIYVAQPLYHTAGGVLAVGITLTAGGSVVIR
ncbi:MAG: AMP-binding protein, partial [Tepidamorphaceae bacterium]